MHTLPATLLETLVHATARAIGCPENEAGEMARHLVGANLAGHDSHGVGMLPDYVRLADVGLLVPGHEPETVLDMPALKILDAGRGVGQWMAKRAMDIAVDGAREAGCCTLALRNSSHVGRIGHYAEQCAREGMVSIHFVNVADHAPLQAPFGCSDPRLGTNPFAVGLPGEDGPALVLDMATSAIAFGKARVARNKGVPVPAGALLDADGHPTTDPTVYVDTRKGALRSFGEHKGSGLAIVCEMLGGGLSGGLTIHPDHERRDGIVNSMLSIVIDAARLGGNRPFAQEVEAIKDYIRQSRIAPGFDEILMPGEPEARSRAKRGRDGIPIDARSLDDILAAARQAGTDAAVIAEVEAARS
ncbi:MAG: malate/lactate/ureidoglycolate dehydrogenase [Geminicoccaceae bacterium]|nr:malate/lactate/ureidoglycolate dehydrogenase [Geminicoccaceae bacterium]